MALLGTGCPGFIGSNFVHMRLSLPDENLINLDRRTYAANLSNLAAFESDKSNMFVQGDIDDRILVNKLLSDHNPPAV